jgi:hypothetical protein
MERKYRDMDGGDAKPLILMQGICILFEDFSEIDPKND